MDVTTVAIVLGSNFFIAASSITVGLVVPVIQMNRERQREQRIRRREIRGEPLLKLKNDLALFAAKKITLATWETVEGAEKSQDLRKELIAYMKTGDFLKTLNEVGEEEKDIHLAIGEALLDWIKVPTNNKSIEPWLANTSAKVRKIQSLINKRLEEL